MQILHRRKKAPAPSIPCAVPGMHDRLLTASCGYSLIPRLRAVSTSQKGALDALYQQYRKGAGQCNGPQLGGRSSN